MIVTGTNGNGNESNALIGSNVADTLDGQAGDDLASFAYSSASVSVGLDDNGGGAAFGAAGDEDQLFNIEDIWGSNQGDWLFGNGSANSISGRGGNDWVRGGGGADRLFGDSGADTLDYYGSGGAVTVNLGANTASDGHAQGDVINGFEHVYGTAFADTLTGNGAANYLWGGDGGDDTLRGGGGGTDRLRGMSGADTLWGGSGGDKFYIGAGESGPAAATRDTIEDFNEAEGDKIDLSGFGQSASGDWVFDFIGGDAFTGIRQVRAEISGGDTYVTATVDGGVDMSLKLEGVVTLEANDFLL